MTWSSLWPLLWLDADIPTLLQAPLVSMQLGFRCCLRPHPQIHRSSHPSLTLTCPWVKASHINILHTGAQVRPMQPSKPCWELQGLCLMEPSNPSFSSLFSFLCLLSFFFSVSPLSPSISLLSSLFFVSLLCSPSLMDYITAPAKLLTLNLGQKTLPSSRGRYLGLICFLENLLLARQVTDPRDSQGAEERPKNCGGVRENCAQRVGAWTEEPARQKHCLLSIEVQDHRLWASTKRSGSVEQILGSMGPCRSIGGSTMGMESDSFHPAIASQPDAPHHTLSMSWRC